MELTMRVQKSRSHTLTYNFIAGVEWLFRIVGLMFTYAIGLFSALFVSVGIIVTLITLISRYLL